VPRVTAARRGNTRGRVLSIVRNMNIGRDLRRDFARAPRQIADTKIKSARSYPELNSGSLRVRSLALTGRVIAPREGEELYFRRNIGFRSSGRGYAAQISRRDFLGKGGGGGQSNPSRVTPLAIIDFRPSRRAMPFCKLFPETKRAEMGVEVWRGARVERFASIRS